MRPITSAAGVTVTQWLVPGDGWVAAPLQPSTNLRFSLVAADDDGPPGASQYAVVQVPDFQAQLASYGTHWPIRFYPLHLALGVDADGGGGGSGGGGGGGIDGPPLVAGTATISLSSDALQDVVFWDSPPDEAPKAPTGGQAPARPAARWAALLAAAVLLLA